LNNTSHILELGVLISMLNKMSSVKLIILHLDPSMSYVSFVLKCIFNKFLPGILPESEALRKVLESHVPVSIIQNSGC